MTNPTIKNRKDTMMKRIFCFAAILALTTATGCQESQKNQSAQILITAKNFKTIAGAQWILQQMIIDGKAITLVGERPYIQFDANESKVTGFASVNRFFGSVKIDKAGRVQWPGPFGATRMAGSPEQMKQEDTFLKSLPKTNRLSTSGINLYAASEDGQIKLIFYVPVE
jgi:heat shock protein HslJ